MRKGLYVLFIFLLIINVCAEKTPVFKYLTNATYGIVREDQEIGIGLLKNIPLSVRKNLDIIKPFVFIPEVKGEYRVYNERFIYFRPFNNFTPGKNYSYRVNLSEIVKNVELDKYYADFNFTVPENRIKSISKEFSPVIGNEENMVNLVCRVDFYHKLTKKDSDPFVEIYDLKNNKILDVKIEIKDNKSLFITSSPVKREDVAKKFRITIKSGIGIQKENISETVLSKFSKFAITNTYARKNGNSLYSEIFFNEKLFNKFNLKGYINIKPELKTDYKIENNKIIISGDFSYGKKYKISVKEGILSALNSRTAQSYETEVVFPDRDPEISFTKSGYFLPSENNARINFKSINLKKVRLIVKKVYTNNIVHFLYNNSLEGMENSDRYYSISSTGDEIYNKIIDVDFDINKFSVSSVDLSEVFKEDNKGIYIIQLYYDDYMEKFSKVKGNFYGRVSKPVIFTDIAMFATKEKEKINVYVKNIKDSTSVLNAKVKLLSNKNQLLDYGYTNFSVSVSFKNDKGFVLLCEKDENICLLRLSSTSIDSTAFNTGGVEENNKVKAFVYSEKDVYRPGDTINLNMILRNKKGTFPENTPVKIEFINPHGQKIYSETSSKSTDGFYTFKLSTKSDYSTGKYRVDISVADEKINHYIRIETIVPYNIKVDLNCDKKYLTKENSSFKLDVLSEYLFGQKAQGLKTEIKLNLKEYSVNFDQWSGFIFDHQGKNRKYYMEKVFRSVLDDKGEDTLEYDFDEFNGISSAANLNLDVTVFEKSSRPVVNSMRLNVFPYEKYIGIRNIDSDYVKTGSENSFKVVLVDKDGNSLEGEKLYYKIYRRKNYWWWDYNTQKEFRKNFKSSTSSTMVKEGFIYTMKNAVNINYKPEDSGEYLLEVYTSETDGHVAACFFGAYVWGNSPKKDITFLETSEIKDEYNPGEKFEMEVKVPENSKAFISLVRSDKVLWEKWEEASENHRISFKITDDMMPNVYLYVCVTQPYKNRNNDLPLSLYTIRNIKVKSEKKQIPVNIQVKDTVKPGERFKVGIKTDKKDAQFTIAVVDRGMLDITGFKTPSPFEYFYSKIRLGVKYFDMFKDIIGIDIQDIYKVFSIGGSDFASQTGKRLDPVDAQRFKSVSLFSGILKTDKNGYAEYTFEMPEYMGQCRIMVIGASGDSYGKAEKNIKVLDDIIILPEFSRVLRPGDRINMPVTIFSNLSDDQDVVLSLKTSGPVSTKSEHIKINLKKGKEHTEYLDLKAEDNIGKADLEFSVRYLKNKKITVKRELAVTPVNVFSTESIVKTVKKQEEFVLRDKDFYNSENKIVLSKMGSLDIAGKITKLSRYPFGCVEQIISKVFPLIYAVDYYDFDYTVQKRMVDDLNRVISNLVKYQTFEGGFSYWPSNRKTDIWASSYVGHFISQARRNGYYVPDFLYKNTIDYLNTQCVNPVDTLESRVYRVYVLTLLGERPLGEMNVLKQNYFDKMHYFEKLMLGYSYKKCGFNDVFEKIIPEDIDIYEFARDTYFDNSSYLREKSILLEILAEISHKDVHKLYEDVVESANNEYMSTYTMANVLRAVSIYNKKYTNDKKVSGNIVFDNGKKIDFVINNKDYTVDVPENIDSFKVDLEKGSKLYARLNTYGISKKSYNSNLNKGISVFTEFLDNRNQSIDIKNLTQGKEFFMHISVTNSASVQIDNIALSQLYPSGWEVDNSFVLATGNEQFMFKGLNLNMEDYKEMRDDRTNFFFSLRSGQKKDFIIKFRAITVGDYIFPATVAESMYDSRFKSIRIHEAVSVVRKN